MRKFLAAALVATLGVGAVGAGVAEARGHARLQTGTLTLVHGIPGPNGFPVDITWTYLANGDSTTVRGVTFGASATVPDMATGRYRLDIRPAGSSTVALSAPFSIGRNQSVSLAAHLNSNGQPAAAGFVDDVRRTRSNQARVIVRHLAVAPAVDVIANDSLKLFRNLANPRSSRPAVIPAGTYNVKVAAAADNSVVALNADLTFAPRTTTVVYAVGDLAGGSFRPVVVAFPNAA